MPALGADMEAGTLVEWMVKPGDTVERGQVVAVVETQKGAIEVEIWQSGKVQRLVVEPGTEVPVGTVLAVLDAEEAAAAPPVAAGPQPAISTAAPMPTAVAAVASAPTRRRVSPAARKRAAELHVDIESISPSTPGGTIAVEDVERVAKPAPQPAPAAADEDWRAQMRKAIAAAMSRSKREIPHYYLASDVDVTDALAWLARLNEARPIQKRLLPAALFMKATALALRSVPGLNGVWRDGVFEPSAAVHLGMAIAMRGGGLVAPAVHDADGKSLDELMANLSDLIGRVRSGRMRSSELADPTVTLTSLGDGGTDRVYGVIYPPQAAILGFGRTALRPWVVDGAIRPRQIVCATLSADHRVSDGHLGARLLGELVRLLADPQRLHEERS